MRVLLARRQRLATASFDRTARLWDVDTGKELLRYDGHDDGPLGVAVTPGGGHLLSWAKDATLRLWPCRAEGSSWVV